MGPDGFWSQHVVQGRTESVFVGLRGLSEEEQYNVNSINSNITGFSGDYKINTKNHLLGLQIGGDCYDVHEGFYWGVKGDVGIYCNFVDGSANVFGTDPSASATPLSVQNNATGQTAAFFGELSFMAGYEVNSHLTLHAGWDLAQLGGLALAPEQVSFTDEVTVGHAVHAKRRPDFLQRSVGRYGSLLVRQWSVVSGQWPDMNGLAKYNKPTGCNPWAFFVGVGECLLSRQRRTIDRPAADCVAGHPADRDHYRRPGVDRGGRDLPGGVRRACQEGPSR